ncbi:MAG: HAMP domain-containing sensor histidine kinase [Dermabacter sp.]|nr:HAMP domain-containing sensor histidine kinase [Dermabacter sp.]
MALSSLRTPSRARRPVSLWTRIVSLIAFVLIAGTLVTGSLSLFLLNRTLIDSIDQDLMRAADSGLLTGDATTLSEGGQEESNAYTPVDFVVEVRSADGQVLRRIVQDQDGELELAFPDLTRDQVIRIQGEPFTLTDGAQDRWRTLALASNAPEGPIMFIALPMRSVEHTMNEMALIIVLVGTMVVFVGVGVGGYVSHWALEPLRDVERTAKHIAAGSLDRRVPVSYTSQEVHTLGTSINEMLVRLEQSFASQAKSEAQAIASESKMRRFVGDASHELRTPLAAIRGFGELYRMGAMRTEEDVTQAMRRIEDEARRMGSLVENLLRLARLDEQHTLTLEPFDVSTVVKDVAQDLRALDPTRTVSITNLTGTVLDPADVAPLGVLGHEEGIRQVVLNLVGNANRHTPKGTPVEVALGLSRSGTALIEVRDHGDGIPAELRERVFERFFRTDESRQRQETQGGGAGLGLSIAATIVQQHNGTISIHQTEGGGATFRVELPAANLDGGTEPDAAPGAEA